MLRISRQRRRRRHSWCWPRLEASRRVGHAWWIETFCEAVDRHANCTSAETMTIHSVTKWPERALVYHATITIRTPSLTVKHASDSAIIGFASAPWFYCHGIIRQKWWYQCLRTHMGWVCSAAHRQCGLTLFMRSFVADQHERPLWLAATRHETTFSSRHLCSIFRAPYKQWLLSTATCINFSLLTASRAKTCALCECSTKWAVLLSFACAIWMSAWCLFAASRVGWPYRFTYIPVQVFTFARSQHIQMSHTSQRISRARHSDNAKDSCSFVRSSFANVEFIICVFHSSPRKWQCHKINTSL